MKLTTEIAQHIEDLFFNGGWVGTDVKSIIEPVDWQEATQKIEELNRIIDLFYHLGYYVTVQLNFLNTGKVVGNDKESWKNEQVDSETKWLDLKEKTWRETQELVAAIRVLEEEKMEMDFGDEKYGSYHRNFLGLLEHTYYHLGQIAVLKKLVNKQPYQT